MLEIGGLRLAPGLYMATLDKMNSALRIRQFSASDERSMLIK